MTEYLRSLIGNHRPKVRTGSYDTSSPPTIVSPHNKNVIMTLHYFEHVSGHSIRIQNTELKQSITIDTDSRRVMYCSDGLTSEQISELINHFKHLLIGEAVICGDPHFGLCQKK